MKFRMRILILYLAGFCICSCSPKQEREKGILYSVQKKAKWGYEDYNGNVVVDYKFDEVNEFKNGTASVKTGDDFMVIDQAGKIISKKYKRIKRLKNGYYLAGEYGKMDLLDELGMILEDSLNNVNVFKQDTSFVLLEKTHKGRRAYNFMDKNKKTCLPMWINQHRSFSFQDIDFQLDDNIFEKNRETALLISFERNKKTKYAYMSNKMKLITDTCFDNGASMQEGYGYLTKKIKDSYESDYYIFDSLGNNVCKIRAEHIIEILPQYKLVTVDTKSGDCVYDLKTGKKISGPFNQIGEGSTSGGYGFGFSAKTLIKVSYKGADYKGFSDGMIKYYQSSLKGGYIDSTGKVAVPAKFEVVYRFSEGLARVSKYNRSAKKTEFAYINKKGELIIPFQYEAAEDFEKGKAFVTLDGRKIIIDKTGKEIK